MGISTNYPLVASAEDGAFKGLETDMVREQDVARPAPPDAMKSPGLHVGVVAGTTGDAFVSSQLLRAISYLAKGGAPQR